VLVLPVGASVVLFGVVLDIPEGASVVLVIPEGASGECAFAGFWSDCSRLSRGSVGAASFFDMVWLRSVFGRDSRRIQGGGRTRSQTAGLTILPCHPFLSYAGS